ncbi:hypothetical protein [Trinickia symbiotica]|uniref:hypothetical protein n=1 Tax=Trinickia symbiotica TaxID=863227 RepID=UPI000399EE56|nr:hypothetical protein [Trinickia symbiotica]
MKIQIDNLVRGILHDLSRPAPSQRELAAFFQAIGADGRSRAAAQRAVLASWAEDMGLPADVRQYVHQQIDALPAF